MDERAEVLRLAKRPAIVACIESTKAQATYINAAERYMDQQDERITRLLAEPSEPTGDQRQFVEEEFERWGAGKAQLSIMYGSQRLSGGFFTEEVIDFALTLAPAYWRAIQARQAEMARLREENLRMRTALENSLELIAGNHNPQASWLLEYDECPKDHPDCCGYCEIIHQVRAALAPPADVEGGD